MRETERHERTVPPDFTSANNRRQKVRAAGLHPDYWYPVEFDKAIKKGESREVVFWKKSIALFRGMDGQLRAIDNRCAHRQLKLTAGLVEGCNLVCNYHGWAYDGKGELVHIPHDLCGRQMPKIKLPSYPVKARYGLIWIFPGDPAMADAHPIPDIPELELARPWGCAPLSFTWNAHHSMIIDNVSDFMHAYLHRKYRPFVDAKLTRSEAVGDKVFVSYRVKVGDHKITGQMVDRSRVDTDGMDLCYEYPYQWSNTGDKIKHWCFVLPIDETTTRVFFLFYFESLKLPFVPVKIPNRVLPYVLKVAKVAHIAPLLSQDGVAVEAEQEGYNTNFDAPLAEINPAVNLFQQLTIRKWEEHLEKAAGRQLVKLGSSQAPAAAAT
jgi:phenylpropionate dioxygenase-like ring-hydroxylating dioxygenase large terminal subunit